MSERASKSEFMEWLDGELEKDPEFRRRVDEALSEMRIEQDLVAIREARGLSQSDLAKRIGVSQPLIARLESGRVKNLTLRTLARYAAGVGAQVRLQVVKEVGGRRGQRSRKRSSR